MMKELMEIQQVLEAPKSQWNEFAKFHYRKCEDILSALKPLLKERGCLLVITDSIIESGGMVFCEATIILTNTEGLKVETKGYARIPESQPGMNASQITGSASSYARKYALNGMFCIDDAIDADHSKQSAGNEKKKDSPDEVIIKKIFDLAAKIFKGDEPSDEFRAFRVDNGLQEKFIKASFVDKEKILEALEGKQKESNKNEA